MGLACQCVNVSSPPLSPHLPFRSFLLLHSSSLCLALTPASLALPPPSWQWQPLLISTTPLGLTRDSHVPSRPHPRRHHPFPLAAAAQIHHPLGFTSGGGTCRLLLPTVVGKLPHARHHLTSTRSPALVQPPPCPCTKIELVKRSVGKAAPCHSLGPWRRGKRATVAHVVSSFPRRLPNSHTPWGCTSATATRANLVPWSSMR